MRDNQKTTESYEAGMPYSLEAEQACLGAVLIDASVIDVLADKLSTDDLYLPEHQVIYTAMLQKMMTGSKIDFITILEAIKGEEFFTREDGKAYLLKLAQTVPSVESVGRYAAIVRQKSDMRKLIMSSKKIMGEAMDPGCDPEVVLEIAEQEIYNIRENHKTGALTLVKETIEDSFDILQKKSDPAQRAQFVGIPTGMNDLDAVTTGLNRSDLIIIGARPATGKTAFILNMALHVALNENRKVALFNLEMSKEQIVNRMISSDAKISGEVLRTGNLSTNEWKRYGASASKMMEIPLYIDDTAGITVTEMKARCRRIPDLGVVFIDYLQLLTDPTIRHDNRATEVSAITRQLKIMAKELNVPVVACAQLAREAEKSKVPALSNLRESGSIEQDADQVLLLHRPDMYINQASDPSSVERNTALIIVAKNRHGRTETIKMNFNGEFVQFTDRTPEQKQQDKADGT